MYVKWLHSNEASAPLVLHSFSSLLLAHAGEIPSWSLLIAITKDDDSYLRIKDSIADFHDKDKCIQFAHLLLKSRQDVMKIENDRSNQDKKDLVRAVLNQWLSSGTCSWQQLIDAMRGADMDKATTDEIATYVLY